MSGCSNESAVFISRRYTLNSNRNVAFSSPGAKGYLSTKGKQNLSTKRETQPFNTTVLSTKDTQNLSTKQLDKLVPVWIAAGKSCALSQEQQQQQQQHLTQD
jgi:hypothetical protein